MPILEHTGAGLSVDGGEVLSVLGAPGSGKSQLALELAFLRRPEAGEVLFHGENPMSRRRLLEPGHRPREVTLLVQNAEDQLFARTVFDDVAFGPRHLAIDEDEIDDRVTRALEAVRLDSESVRDRSPFALSGGERRRVALAGVLAMEPEVLILDEPTANLDPRTRSEFLQLLTPLRGRSAIIWLTSRAREATLADDIYLLEGSRLTAVKSGEELFGGWRELARAGVELPSVYQLAGELEDRGWALPATGSARTLEESIVEEWRDRRNDR